MPIWKWILLLIAFLLLTTLAYSLSQIPHYFLDGPLFWAACVLMSAAMLGLYYLLTRWFEKEKPADIPLGKCATGTGLGFVMGAVLFSAVVGVMYAVTLYTVDSVTLNTQALVQALFMYLVVAVGEEITFRGVLFRWIDQRFGFWWAMAVSGLFFGLAHIFNDGATVWSSVAIALEAGLMLAAAYKWSGNLWVPIGIHWAWNWVQGSVFGFAVSGMQQEYSLLQPTIDGPEWLTGGIFGAEASVISAVLGLTLTAWFVKEYLKRQTPR